MPRLTWKVIALGTGTVAALAAFLSNIGSIQSSFEALRHPGAEGGRLEVTGLAVTKGDTIDVSILNPSHITVVVSSAEAHASAIWPMMSIGRLLSKMTRTGTYAFLLPLKTTPYTSSHSVAHEVKPNDSDLLGFTFAGDNASYFVLFQLMLSHSGAGHQLVTDPILHCFRSPNDLLPSRATYEEWKMRSTYDPALKREWERVRDAYLANSEIIKQISTLKALRTKAVHQCIEYLRR